MPDEQQCPKCGAILPGDAPKGLCPRCLMAAALEESRPAAAKPTIRVEPDAGKEPLEKIDRYKILQKLGEGGCGVVYMAEQTEPVRRKVALKVIKLGMDTKQVIARFEAERQALALMDHPNIAKVLDAGATATGRPYFVMELVKGIRITDYCDQNHLSTTERLGLFTQVCQAIQHAHQKGIIHRDIKPSNILVTLHDGKPVPKVIDFGIAKATEQPLTEKTVFTAFGQFMGTPAYMSPEQAELSGLDIDTRSDIYALGVLLYELLTGRTPFDAKELLQAGLDEMRRRIREEEPVRPSTRLSTMMDADLTEVAQRRQSESGKLTRFIRGDLDWIVMKCLEKDRTRRYVTADGVAADIQRHLNHEPVVACPPSSMYRFQKAWQRNKKLFATVVLIGVVLLAAAAVSVWQATRATQAEVNEKAARLIAEESNVQEAKQHKLAEQNARKAIESEQSAKGLLYAADMRLAQQAWGDGNLSLMDSLLQAHRPQPGEADPRGFEYFCLQELGKGEQEDILYGHTNAAVGIAISPDGKWLASRGETDVRVWDLKNRSLIAILSSPDMRVPVPNQLGKFCPSFSHDSQYLAIGTDTGLQLFYIPTRQIKTLSIGPVTRAVFSPVTNQIAFNIFTNHNLVENVVRVWDYEGNKEISPSGFEGSGRLLGWSPDGTGILTGRGMERLDWYDTVTSTHRQTDKLLNAWVLTAAISPDGSLLAAIDWQGTVHLSETDDLKEIGTLASGDIHASALAFSPDGKLLATGSGNQVIQIWDVAGKRLERQLRGHRGRIAGLAFSPDGRVLASTADDGKVMLWDPLGQSENQIANGIDWPDYHPPQFSSDGKLVCLDMDEGNRFSFLDSASLRETFSVITTNIQEMLSLSPDSKQFVIMTTNPTPELLVRVAETSSNRATIHLNVPDKYPYKAQLSPDGTIIAVNSTDHGTLEKILYKAATGEQILSFNIQRWFYGLSCFLPDGRTYASAQGSGIDIWDLSSRKKTRTLECNSQVSAISISPDGQALAAALEDHSILMWDLKSGATQGALFGSAGQIVALTFSPDGRTLASGGEDGMLRFWSFATHRELASFRIGAEVGVLAFSPDNQMLVSGGIGSYRVWRAPRSGTAVKTVGSPLSIADLPANSIWRVPDGDHVGKFNLTEPANKASDP